VLVAASCQRDEAPVARGEGYVIKQGEGENACGFLIKASPKTGTGGAAMLAGTTPPGGSVGLHSHESTDEFFYISAGSGAVFVSGREIPIHTGDVIFIPRGTDHKLRNTDPVAPMEAVFFVDKPGLADEFREAHAQYCSAKRMFTLDELNAITKKYGTTYKSLIW